ncbi:unnamed protein product [Ambrosiozyma monospora]|uniref:Unnamed protein product n=1 Tax=Ambrosiozyma monospora TaxID=43982 RepID=A0ACB5TAZ4_AMBMO|nr:unnamed protein product [Ambrosiozyma monospora]
MTTEVCNGNINSSWKNGVVLISGAGLIGLTIAHMLEKLSIPYSIYDRDENENFRGQGWGITLHWALEDFLSLLPAELHKDIYESEVLENFHMKDTGNFMFINAGTGETVVRIPPTKRLRVRREGIRKTLLKDMNVHWGCEAESVEINQDASDVNKRVSVTFHNGKTLQGGMFIDCEGRSSLTRKLANPEHPEACTLPYKFVGSIVELTPEEYHALAAKYDPLLFQGTIPSSGTFFWFSLLSSPTHNGTSNYKCQVNISWKLADGVANLPFASVKEAFAEVSKRTTGLHESLVVLRDKLLKTGEKDYMELCLGDWPFAEWDDYNGLLLLAGDAAHAMVMYRGEAANHGIADAKLLEGLL